MEVTRRRGRRRKNLLDDLKDRRGYSHLKEGALDRTMWRNRFGGGFGPVVRQNIEWMNEWILNLRAGMMSLVWLLVTGWAVRGSKSGGAKLYAPVQMGSGTRPVPSTMGTESLYRGYSCRSVTLTTHPNLAPRLNNENSYTSTPHSWPGNLTIYHPSVAKDSEVVLRFGEINAPPY